MDEKIITIENVSKHYVIQHENAESYTALRDVIANGAKSAIQHIKGAARRAAVQSIRREIFKALDDVNLTVRRGDRVGIIGRNGAGKSTLLKILSRITEPTKGRITLRGRVASLLEVGTGFHPELTGRENVFLNGSVLGMKRTEINRKFDEIVAFAEIERFLDTPVKRYSSGMYVRLAFAVAAHLEPEILLVDEVLAVGDAQFQKKCLGKMEDVSMNETRTVIFVSHNMTAIKALCNTCILLDSGKVIFNGDVTEATDRYLACMNTSPDSTPIADRKRRSGMSLRARILDISVITEYGENPEYIDSTQPVTLKIKIASYNDNTRFALEYYVADEMRPYIWLNSGTTSNRMYNLQKGIYEIDCKIAPFFLYAGDYRISCVLSVPGQELIDYVPDSYFFTISSLDPYNTGYNLQKNYGFAIYHVSHEWKNEVRINDI